MSAGSSANSCTTCGAAPTGTGLITKRAPIALEWRKHERPGSPRRSNRRLRRHTLRHMPTPVIASLGHRNL
ncbi:hypothetical protein PBI_FLABSLAB_19 [Mycobacterium phage Flabslab]|nr:hypothetical protein PBI_FLABSLAB_19 [Mycobacterium phage Flabslab]